MKGRSVIVVSMRITPVMCNTFCSDSFHVTHCQIAETEQFWELEKLVNLLRRWLRPFRFIFCTQCLQTNLCGVPTKKIWRRGGGGIFGNSGNVVVGFRVVRTVLCFALPKIWGQHAVVFVLSSQICRFFVFVCCDCEIWTFCMGSTCLFFDWSTHCARRHYCFLFLWTGVSRGLMLLVPPVSGTSFSFPPLLGRGHTGRSVLETFSRSRCCLSVLLQENMRDSCSDQTHQLASSFDPAHPRFDLGANGKSVKIHRAEKCNRFSRWSLLWWLNRQMLNFKEPVLIRFLWMWKDKFNPFQATKKIERTKIVERLFLCAVHAVLSGFATTVSWRLPLARAGLGTKRTPSSPLQRCSSQAGLACISAKRERQRWSGPLCNFSQTFKLYHPRCASLLTQQLEVNLILLLFSAVELLVCLRKKSGSDSHRHRPAKNRAPGSILTRKSQRYVSFHEAVWLVFVSRPWRFWQCTVGLVLQCLLWSGTRTTWRSGSTASAWLSTETSSSWTTSGVESCSTSTDTTSRWDQLNTRQCHWLCLDGSAPPPPTHTHTPAAGPGSGSSARWWLFVTEGRPTRRRHAEPRGATYFYLFTSLFACLKRLTGHPSHTCAVYRVFLPHYASPTLQSMMLGSPCPSRGILPSLCFSSVWCFDKDGVCLSKDLAWRLYMFVNICPPDEENQIFVFCRIWEWRRWVIWSDCSTGWRISAEQPQPSWSPCLFPDVGHCKWVREPKIPIPSVILVTKTRAFFLSVVQGSKKSQHYLCACLSSCLRWAALNVHFYVSVIFIVWMPYTKIRIFVQKSFLSSDVTVVWSVGELWVFRTTVSFTCWVAFLSVPLFSCTKMEVCATPACLKMCLQLVFLWKCCDHDTNAVCSYVWSRGHVRVEVKPSAVGGPTFLNHRRMSHICKCPPPVRTKQVNVVSLWNCRNHNCMSAWRMQIAGLICAFAKSLKDNLTTWPEKGSDVEKQSFPSWKEKPW